MKSKVRKLKRSKVPKDLEKGLFRRLSKRIPSKPIFSKTTYDPLLVQAQECVSLHHMQYASEGAIREGLRRTLFQEMCSTNAIEYAKSEEYSFSGVTYTAQLRILKKRS